MSDAPKNIPIYDKNGNHLYDGTLYPGNPPQISVPVSWAGWNQNYEYWEYHKTKDAKARLALEETKKKLHDFINVPELRMSCSIRGKSGNLVIIEDKADFSYE
jgi:hypothetical protein